MIVIRNALKLEDLRRMAASLFGELVKAVVDVDGERLKRKRAQTAAADEARRKRYETARTT